MADYNGLKSSVAAVIKTNNRREITGQLLQNVLTQMINVIGDNYQLAGFADPTTNPQSPDQNVFYVAEQSGVYPYFDNIIVPEGVTFLMWKNSQWTAHTIGVVTTEYLSENYVTKEFFRSMFRAYDSHGVEIEPNNDGEEPSVIDNIKAMVGLWTDEYISALGQGSGGGGGGGSTSLAGLTDVAINSETLAGGQGLVYNATTHKWVNGSVVVNMSSVWSALAASTNEQINASHLSAALTGFATQTWVNDNYISIAYFDRLFRAYNGNTLISHNDTTSTIDNIKAMFGFWTEQYLSALGNSGGGSVSLTLANMGDVALNNLADGQFLTYNATTGKWVNTSAAPSGATALSGLTDVALSSLADKDLLQWDYARGKWKNVVLSTVMSGYALASSIPTNVSQLNNDSGYITSSALSGCVKYAGNQTSIGSGSPVSGAQAWASSANLPNGNALVYDDSDYEYSMLFSFNPSGSGYGTILRWGHRDKYIYITRRQGNYWMDGSTDWAKISAGYADSAGSVDWGNVTGKPSFEYLPLTGGTLTGRLTINSGVLNITGETNYGQGIRLHPFDGTSSIFFGCDANSGMSAGMFGITHDTTGLRIRGQASTSSTSLVDYLTVAYGGNVGIGTTSPNYKLHVNGTLGAGNTSVANLESEGYVSALSDIRKKEVVEYMEALTIEQIASMPIIKFTWKDRPEEGLQVGSVAQEWQRILPQSVHKSKNDYLSFSYGVAALVGTISNSRELVKHDARLSKIEKMLNINIA